MYKFIKVPLANKENFLAGYVEMTRDEYEEYLKSK